MAFHESSLYKDIASKIIETYPERFCHIDVDKVCFLSEDEKCPRAIATCRRVTNPYTYLLPYKFIITVYELKVAAMSEAQLNLVIYHELLHIAEDFTKLKHHDVEDFIECIEIAGCLDWTLNPDIPNVLDKEIPQVESEESNVVAFLR